MGQRSETLYSQDLYTWWITTITEAFPHNQGAQASHCIPHARGPAVIRQAPRMSGSEGQWGTCGRTCQPTKDSLAHQPHPGSQPHPSRRAPRANTGALPSMLPVGGACTNPPAHFLYKRIDICVFITESLYYTPQTNTTL